MAPALGIRCDQALTVTLSGLSTDEAALLQKIILTSDRPDRPASEHPQPGVFLIHGSLAQLRHCFGRLSGHEQLPVRLRSLFISKLDNYLRTDYKIVTNGAVLDLGSRTHIMGVLNVTPDSFSDGGRYADPGRAVDHGRQMAAEGADIIDIGGESTRPGAEPLPEDEELRRILPVIERLSRECATPISVDTYKSAVAEKALQAGASLVNDISGLRFSPNMAQVAADHGAAVVIMHMQGTPRDMQQNPVYADVVGEIMAWFEERIELALAAGVPRDRVLIDPGIGFGKTREHNLEILNRLHEFRSTGCPVVIGTSRKRFIGAVLGIDDPAERLAGTAATVALAIERGAQVVRVHDVLPLAQVARMTDAVLRSRNAGSELGCAGQSA